MKYLLFSFFVLSSFSVSYGNVYPIPANEGEEPVLATFSISIHLDRYDNLPVYQETHLMTDLEQGFKLGHGSDIVGDWKQIDWHNDLVFVRIVQINPNFPASESISMLKYTNEGMQVKRIEHQSEDFALNVSVNH